MAEPERTTHEKKMRFIELRAKGHSLARCAADLKISKSTAFNWGHELEYEIGRVKAIELEALFERFAMLKEARIEFLAGQLETIRTELKTRGLSDVPTAKILEAQLTYWKELMAELVDIRLAPADPLGDTETRNNLNGADIEKGLLEVYSRRRAGLISAKEAKEELGMLEALRQAHDQTVLEEHFVRIESILEDRN